MAECRYSSAILTSALQADEWSGLRSDRFSPEERAPGAHWIGGCVDLSRSGRYREENIIAFASNRTPDVQTITRHSAIKISSSLCFVFFCTLFCMVMCYPPGLIS
jgi:hypothetical protein